MKQKLLLKSMLLLFALIAGSSSVWATEVLHYTLDGTTTGGSSGYDNAGEITQDEMTWYAMGNTTMNPWRIGGKSLTDADRPIYSNTAMGAAITKVEVVVGAASNVTVNSVKLLVYDNSDFVDNGTDKHKLDEVTKSFSANSTLTFNPTYGTEWATGAFYKIIFNLTISATSNKFVEFKSAKFFKEVTLTDPTITFNDGSVRVGKTLDVSTLFTSNSTGAVTYSITAGGSYATLEGTTLTAGATVGSVTVKAQQVAKDEFNAGEKSATISVVDPALSSITITTAPTKLTYDEGEEFDATGAVVTATFADASTEDVTASCTWTPTGALTTSDTEVTVSYTYNAVTKTATQDITVNAYVQPTEFDIALKNSLFGTSYDGSASGITDSNPVIGTLNHVTVTYAGSGNHYINDSQIRFYPNNKLTFEAPVGYVITKIVFTSGGTWAATINSDKGTYTSGTKTWAGVASTVVFTGSGSSRCDMSKAAITLSSTVPVTIASSGYSTIAVDCGLDFANATPAGLEAYVASAVTASGVTLTAKDEAPASTGVILKGDASTVYTIPVKAAAAAVGTNYLHAAVTATTLDDGSFYILKGGKFCKVTGAADAAARTVPAGKAYLLASDVPASAPDFLGFSFDGTTGIESFETPKNVMNGEFYNLAGQRVAQPTKGLYIVNGKKVIIK